MEKKSLSLEESTKRLIETFNKGGENAKQIKPLLGDFLSRPSKKYEKDIVCIIGPSRGNKTTLSTNLQKALGFSYIPADIVVEMVAKYLPQTGVCHSNKEKTTEVLSNPLVHTVNQFKNPNYPGVILDASQLTIESIDKACQTIYEQSGVDFRKNMIVICLGYPNATPEDLDNAIQQNDVKGLDWTYGYAEQSEENKKYLYDELELNIKRSKENQAYCIEHKDEIIKNGGDRPWVEFVDVSYGPIRPYIIKNAFNYTVQKVKESKIQTSEITETAKSPKTAQSHTQSQHKRAQIDEQKEVTIKDLQNDIMSIGRRYKNKVMDFLDGSGVTESIQAIKSKMPNRKEIFDYLNSIGEERERSRR